MTLEEQMEQIKARMKEGYKDLHFNWTGTVPCTIVQHYGEQDEKLLGWLQELQRLQKLEDTIIKVKYDLEQFRRQPQVHHMEAAGYDNACKDCAKWLGEALEGKDEEMD
jgi:hypothetical protein